MQSSHGSVGPFDREAEEWSSYCERVEHYLAANAVENPEQRRAILLSVCGPTTYQLIRSLVAPGKPSDRSFPEIVQLVQEHLTPTPSAIMQRFMFNGRVQKEEESIADFVAALRKLAQLCEFGDTLEQMLRDRIVCGIKDSRVQRRLLAEPMLTFAKALEIAQASELAEKNALVLQGQRQTTPSATPHSPAEVNAIAGQDRAAKQSPPKRQFPPCSSCGRKHVSSSCPCADWVCFSCGKVGHVARVCRSNTGSHSKQPKRLQRKMAEVQDKATVLTLSAPTAQLNPPLLIVLSVDGIPLAMEIDTGAAVSLISETTYRSHWSEASRPPLEHTSIVLKAYSGVVLTALGQITVTVSHKHQSLKLRLLIIQGDGPSLLGRDWLFRLHVNREKLAIFHTRCSSVDLEGVLAKHADLFRDELGLVKGAPVKLHVESTCKPRFFKPRPVPYALRGKVEAELERLLQAGVIEPVRWADWAAPIVPVMKRDGSVRICGDYKMTVNLAATVETYPLPRVEDLLASIGNGRVFSKLDLANAYTQLELAEESKTLVTINTHKGLFRYNRLPFGVAAAPAIFQRTMESILRDIPHVCVYLDDVLVSGESESAHLQTLELVLSRLQQAGFRLKLAKCAFMLPSLEYLGHVISEKGVHPTEEKKQAIANAPAPVNVTQLRSFLGMLTYYGKFLPNLATTLCPLYELLQKNKSWSWGKQQESAFRQAKKLLTSAEVLVHFDPSKELLLACDASPYGVAAVLSHKLADGSDRPIAYASRTLSPAEKKYAQIEKEGLAVIFGVTRFHQYIYGREFTIVSDHKPLQFLLSESRAISPMASARIQRWALTLGSYRYHIQYKAGKLQANVDALSRLPLEEPAMGEEPTQEESVLMMEVLERGSFPVSSDTVRKQTTRDPVLARVKNMVVHGNWDAAERSEDVRPYASRKWELSVQGDCVLWGSRVVIPKACREAVLEMLHEAHPGIDRMKALARSVVWWPGIDGDLEKKVKSCQPCQVNAKSSPVAPLHPWEFPTRPWSRLHIDFAGPFLGKLFVVLVDSYSKWLEVAVVPSCSTSATIRFLRNVFATHGTPDQIVSDNGTAFSSVEFKSFLERNNIRHSTSAPYHPSSNGLAERYVQTFKEALKKSQGDIETRLARFLFMYRLTPQSTTGQCPAELLLGRRPRSPLDALHPDLSEKVVREQQRQKTIRDRHARFRELQPGDLVYARNYNGLPKWLPGVVTKCTGPVSVVVDLGEGRGVCRRHLDQVRTRYEASRRGSCEEGELSLNAGTESVQGGEQATAVSPGSTSREPATDVVQAPVASSTTSATSEGTGEKRMPVSGASLDAHPEPTRRSTRRHTPPDRYGL